MFQVLGNVVAHNRDPLFTVQPNRRQSAVLLDLVGISSYQPYPVIFALAWMLGSSGRLRYHRKAYRYLFRSISPAISRDAFLK